METISNLISNYQAMRRFSASMLAGKMAGMVALSTILPAQGLAATDLESLFVGQSAATEQATIARAQLVLDPAEPVFPVTVASRPELTITLVESQAEAKARSTRTVIRSNVASDSVLTDVSFQEKRALAQAAAQQYGIDWKLLEAVWQIESGKRWQTAVQSSAGAQGPMQFMPGTWRAYAVDGNGDGVTSVTDARDAVYAGAKYLAANGAATNVDQALLRYNHAQWYVEKVKNIAATIEG